MNRGRYPHPTWLGPLEYQVLITLDAGEAGAEVHKDIQLSFLSAEQVELGLRVLWFCFQACWTLDL